VDLTSPYVTAGSSFSGITTFSYWKNEAATIPVADPTSVGGGTYYIKASSLPDCITVQPVTVTINPLPAVYPVTGSGSYCAGGQGREIIMTGSQPGIIYTLWYGCCLFASQPVVGDGNPISFGYQTGAGIYSIVAENPLTLCVNWMYNCIYIFIDQPVPVSVEINTSANPVPAGTEVTFNALATNGGTNPAYQWLVNGLNAGNNQPTFTYVPVNEDDVACIVTSDAYCVSGNPALSNTIVMEVEGLTPSVTVAGIIFDGQVKCYNATQTLIIAGGGNTFTVKNGGSVTMIAGQNIRYLVGTTVEPGGYMRGHITTDNQYCGQKSPTIPTVYTGEPESSGITVPALSLPLSFSLYPNPTSGAFTIAQTGEKTFASLRVIVYGTRGEIVMSGDWTGENSHAFDMTDFPSGIYFVKVITEGYAQTFKLVKTQ
jgi:hypothetical protein